MELYDHHQTLIVTNWVLRVEHEYSENVYARDVRNPTNKAKQSNIYKCPTKDVTLTFTQLAAHLKLESGLRLIKIFQLPTASSFSKA